MYCDGLLSRDARVIVTIRVVIMEGVQGVGARVVCGGDGEEEQGGDCEGG